MEMGSGTARTAFRVENHVIGLKQSRFGAIEEQPASSRLLKVVGGCGGRWRVWIAPSGGVRGIRRGVTGPNSMQSS